PRVVPAHLRGDLHPAAHPGVTGVRAGQGVRRDREAASGRRGAHRVALDPAGDRDAGGRERLRLPRVGLRALLRHEQPRPRREPRPARQHARGRRAVHRDAAVRRPVRPHRPQAGLPARRRVARRDRLPVLRARGDEERAADPARVGAGLCDRQRCAVRHAAGPVLRALRHEGALLRHIHRLPVLRRRRGRAGAVRRHRAGRVGRRGDVAGLALLDGGRPDHVRHHAGVPRDGTREDRHPMSIPGVERSAAEPLGPHLRNLPDHDGTVGDVGGIGWHVTDLLLPTLTLRRSALDHNLALFARWCTEVGVDHAPHGKTTMSPQLVAEQLDAGAWAITAATVAQARLMHRWGVPRVLLAHEVVDPVGLRWLAADPGFEVYVLADGAAGVDRMSAAFADAGRTLPVLVELGVPGGRAGARTREEALAVARRVAEAPGLELAGVECFEGVYPQDRAERSLAQVDRFAADLASLLVDVDRLAGDRAELVLTAGGSAYPDRVVAAWQDLPPLSRSVRKVVRSGGYLTHDHGLLARAAPFDLRPAMELWA